MAGKAESTGYERRFSDRLRTYLTGVLVGLIFLAVVASLKQRNRPAGPASAGEQSAPGSPPPRPVP